MKQTLRVLVVGATGGSGLATVKELLAQGHQVTAFSRKATTIPISSEQLEKVDGDAMNPEDVERVVKGKDAVIVTLGINENPIKVRLFGSSGTPMKVRSQGTSYFIQAMKRHGVKRLIVQTTYGIGETKKLLPWKDKLLIGLLLAPQFQDSEVQEGFVRASGLDWVLAQPVHLNDNEEELERPFISIDGSIREMSVARKQVAQFLVQATVKDDYIGRSVSISG